MLPLMRNTFINDYDTRVALSDFILRADRLSMGEQCLSFEKEFSHYQNRSYAALFNSGGSANLALLQALKNLGRLKEGDKIGFTALTWSTNVMPIIQMGFQPVPIDCSLSCLNVTSRQLLQVEDISSLSAIFLTNVLGYLGDYPQLIDICSEFKIILLEDNCESLGSILNNTNSGNFGLASTFSFFVAHHMSTIEGGMVCTGDSELSNMLSIVRANGWDRNLKASDQHRIRQQHSIVSEFEAKYAFYDLGFNLRPTEITGFLGRNQLKHLEANIESRLRNYTLIHEALSHNSDFYHLDYRYLDRLSPFAMPFVCKSPDLRRQYLEQFSGAGIEVRPMIAGNITKQPFYQKYCNHVSGESLCNTDIIDTCGFYCGNYPEMNSSDLDLILSALS